MAISSVINKKVFVPKRYLQPYLIFEGKVYLFQAYTHLLYDCIPPGACIIKLFTAIINTAIY
jgi:hypothetical protein